jgi:hypothetical protein
LLFCLDIFEIDFKHTIVGERAVRRPYPVRYPFPWLPLTFVYFTSALVLKSERSMCG